MTDPQEHWHVVQPPGAARKHVCSHVAQTHLTPPGPLPVVAAAGCAECLASSGRWVNRLLCLACGHIGCCDSSRGKHAYLHAHDHPGHELARTLKGGEDWVWCYIDEVFLQPGPQAVQP